MHALHVQAPPIKGMPHSPTANMYVAASDDAGQAQAYDQSPRPAAYAMPQHHYSPRVGGYEPSGMSAPSGMNMYTGVPQGAANMYGQAVMHSPSHGHGQLQHQGVMHSPGRVYQAAPHAMAPQGGQAQGWTAAGM